jgi:hypothetical protein
VVIGHNFNSSHRQKKIINLKIKSEELRGLILILIGWYYVKCNRKTRFRVLVVPYGFAILRLKRGALMRARKIPKSELAG